MHTLDFGARNRVRLVPRDDALDGRAPSSRLAGAVTRLRATAASHARKPPLPLAGDGLVSAATHVSCTTSSTSPGPRQLAHERTHPAGLRQELLEIMHRGMKEPCPRSSIFRERTKRDNTREIDSRTERRRDRTSSPRFLSTPFRAHEAPSSERCASRATTAALDQCTRKTRPRTARHHGHAIDDVPVAQQQHIELGSDSGSKRNAPLVPDASTYKPCRRSNRAQRARVRASRAFRPRPSFDRHAWTDDESGTYDVTLAPDFDALPQAHAHGAPSHPRPTLDNGPMHPFEATIAALRIARLLLWVADERQCPGLAFEACMHLAAGDWSAVRVDDRTHDSTGGPVVPAPAFIFARFATRELDFEAQCVELGKGRS
jgi:hypothetical protein